MRKPIKSSAFRKGISLKDRYFVFKRDNYRCLVCGKSSLEGMLVVDHHIPIVLGGTKSLDNLRTLCRECNTDKMILEERL